MKKIIAVALTLIVALTMTTGCGKGNSGSDEITMFVGLGNSQAYYEELQKVVKDELGYDITFIFKRTEDMTNAINQEFANNDLCADIICTASPAGEEEWLYDSCVNYLTESNLTSKFSYSKVQECTCEDGGVYQLPFTSRLIGITYNKTLMEEQGFEVPTTFDEMVALKKKCDAAGIPFAVTGDFATGHGFNWLFHIMGSQWLTTIEGTAWIEDYLKGDADIDEFAKEASYFKKYCEAGLFGELYTDDWNASDKFNEERALFYYDITNSCYGNGDDVYATMPWISEDGKNNSFTYYDNMYISLNKDLENNPQKLEKVLEILDLMTTEKVTSIFTDEYKDGYVAVEDYNVQKDALYGDFADCISEGFLQPWYYSYFDQDTVVHTGEVINSYMNGQGATFDDIMKTLDESNNNNLNRTNPVFGEIEKTLGYEDLAKFEAMCGAQSLQKKLEQAGEKAEVQVALMPYIEEESDIPPWTEVEAVNTKLYAGTFEQVYLNSIILPSAKNPEAVYMTGSEINELVSAGYMEQYPIAVITRGGFEIAEDEEYLVAVNYSTLPEGKYEEYIKKDKVLQPGDLEAVDGLGVGLVPDGIRAYFEENDSLNPETMEWN